MVVEHIGVEVSDPFAMSKWYVKNLGFKIIFSSEGDSSSNPMAFISDESGDTILEFFHDPSRQPLCELLKAPAQFHIALSSADPQADKERLVKAGAEYLGSMDTSHKGETLLALRDPFGNMVQLVKRGAITVRK
jgi:catechol 2,3-dioxygenase-like lactoylglutathione lyase family enzyme